jgi:hypothetical protein
MNYRQVILFFCAFFVVTLSSAQIFEVRDELNESSKRSYGMGVGDLDGNGLDDIILSNSSIGKISWKPQVSPREFGSEIIISMLGRCLLQTWIPMACKIFFGQEM